MAISEDLYNYKINDNGIVLQDSYFALRSYDLMKQKYPDTLAKEVYKLLQLFPKPTSTSPKTIILGKTILMLYYMR